MKIFIISFLFVFSVAGIVFCQSELTTDTKMDSKGIPANTSFGLLPGEIEIIGNPNPPFNPDWMGTDIKVYDGTTTNINKRELDLKLGKDGNLYLAMCINNTSFHGIRCYRSTNSGLNWTLIRSVSGTSNAWYTGLSMLVVRNHLTNNDSMRVLIFFTHTLTNNTNDDATLRMFSFLGNGAGASILATIDEPTTGKQYCWPSAVTDAALVSITPSVGVALIEYDNNSGNFYRIKYFFMPFLSYNVWTEYSAYMILGGLNWPSAAFASFTNTTITYIATEFRNNNASQIRLYGINFSGPSGDWSYDAVTTNTSYHCIEPVLTIPQTKPACNEAIISYIRTTTYGATDGVACYSYTNNHSTYTQYTLSNSQSSRFTWIASDSSRATNDYCLAIYGDFDSLNVKRGSPLNMGTQYSDRTNNYIPSSARPVCAIYKNGSMKRSAFAYFGVESGNPITGVYFDSENLPTNVKNTEGSVYSYELSQNYPNPFNPVTYINYSIPKSGFVKLSVFDILGKEVATLVNSNKPEGSYEVIFDASRLSSGVYFYKITAGEYIEVKKMSVIK